MNHHLAQINIAYMLAPIDDPIMADFVAQLDEINAIADEAPGFVWRLQTDEGDATAIRPFDDEMILVNMSVWESADALHAYTYRSAHAGVFKRKKEWFKPFNKPFMALWWVPAGHIPTPQEGREMLEHLQAHGPTPAVFTFKDRFPPPEAG